MAVTQNELATALATFLSTNPVRIAMRSGLSTELDLADLVVGEIALATDTLQVWICTSLGTVVPLTGLTILGYYANAGALASAHPTGTAGQIYAVGSAPTHLYTWDGSAWADMGAMNDTSTFATQAQLNGKVSTTGDETIAGVKTLSSSPIVPTPTTDMQASTKKYVDDGQALDVKLTGDQTVAGVKTFSSSPIVPTPTTDMQAAPKKYTDDHAALSLLTNTVHGLAVTAANGTVTPAAETGTLTTATGTYAYYRVGKMLTYHIYVSIVNKGTGDGALDVSGLPINFNTRTCGTGVDFTSGVPLRIYTTTSGVMRIYRYDNTTAIATGATLSLDITGITA